MYSRGMKLSILFVILVLAACEPGPSATPTATTESIVVPIAAPTLTATPTTAAEPTDIPTAAQTPSPTAPGPGPCAPGGEIPTEAIFSAIKRTLELPESFSTSTGIEHASASHGGVEWWVSFEATDKRYGASEAGRHAERFVRGYWTPDCEVHPLRPQGQREWMRSARVVEAWVHGVPYVTISPGSAPTPTSSRCAPGGEVPTEAVLEDVKDHMYAPETFTTSTGIEHAPSSRGNVLWWIGFEGVLGNGIPFDGFARGTWLPE